MLKEVYRSFKVGSAVVREVKVVHVAPKGKILKGRGLGGDWKQSV